VHNAPTQGDYEAAIKSWAAAILSYDGALMGLAMGKAVTLADQLGIGMVQVANDIQTAKWELNQGAESEAERVEGS
jgi:hypothetical protein